MRPHRITDGDPVMHANAPRLDGSLSEQSFAARVDEFRQLGSPFALDLVPLLSVSHEVFCGRSASSAIRMRAYAMAALEDTGLPGGAVPYVVEVLETSFQPSLVAAAARAIRGAAEPDTRLANHLIHSIYNIWQKDQPVSFEAYDLTWPLARYSTALTDVLHALTWLGASAHHVIPELKTLLSDYPERFSPRIRTAILRCIDALQSSISEPPRACCGSKPLIDAYALAAKGGSDIGSIKLEDQDGQTFEWRHFFNGKPSAVAFFYATCKNPLKCVQTIYNLVEIHRALSEAGLSENVRLAAITYDPQRDTPTVLLQYGTSKGVPFDANCKLMRVPDQFAKVVEAFDLGVNYDGTQVNDHQIELYLLDRDGDIADGFLRLQADPESVVAKLAQLTREPRGKCGNSKKTKGHECGI